MTDSETIARVASVMEAPDGVEFVRRIAAPRLSGLPLYPEATMYLAGPLAYAYGTIPPSHWTFSQEFFGEYFHEYNRTLSALYMLHALLVGEREAFPQLSEDRFVALQNLLVAALGKEGETHAMTQPGAVPLAWLDAQKLDGMFAWMVDHDLGKTRRFLEAAAAKGGLAHADHDNALTEAITAWPELVPSLARLAPDVRGAILDAQQSGLNLPAIVQLAHTPAVLEGARGIGAGDWFYYMLHIIVDVAGAEGHNSPLVSQVWKDSVHDSFMEVFRLCRAISEGRMDEKQAYDAYITRRAAECGLDANDPLERAAARICAVLRTDNPEMVDEVLCAFAGLSDAGRDLLVRELNCTGLEGEPALAVGYMPEIFRGLLRHAVQKPFPDVALADIHDALSTGLEVLARLFGEARASLRAKDVEGNGQITIEAMGIVVAQRTDPYAGLKPEMKLQWVGEEFAVEFSQERGQVR